VNFEIVGGSVVGYDHVRRGQAFLGANNQDAHAIARDPMVIVGVVCDGCGSQPRSELGAAFTANIVVDRVLGGVLYSDPGRGLWETIESDVYRDLYKLGQLYKKWPIDCLLTTILGFIILEEETTLFYVGDGYFGVNGLVERIESPIENTPPYFAYQFLRPTDEADDDFVDALGPRPYSFQVRTWPTAEVRSIFVATDGLRDLIANEGGPLPSLRSQRVPSVPDLLDDDTIYLNPFRLGNRLTAMNDEGLTLASGRARRVPGLLLDDTTIVVARMVTETDTSDSRGQDGSQD